MRIEFGRREEFVSGRTRHGARIRTKVGVKADGTITAIHTTAYVDCGAYAASGPGVTRRLGQGSLYLYRCPNARYDGHLVYTNRPVGGSYRALGAPQGHFALESTMDRIAETLGMDPLEFRLKNRVPPEGQPGTRTTPADAIVDTQPVEGGIPFSSNGLEQCLRQGASAFGWGGTKQILPDPSRKIGRGMAMLIYRGGPGNLSSAEIRLDREGRVRLMVGTMDVGEGAETVLAQLAAETLGVGYDDVDVISADTSVTPIAPITAGSTATFSTGTAVVQAAGELRDKLLELATVGLEVSADQLEARGGYIYVQDSPERRMSLAEVARHIPGDVLTAYAEITPGSTEYIVNAFGAHFVEVEVDTLTGKVYIRRYVAAHDSGRILSPTAALNQVEGGISQMLGYTLSEELITDGPTGITLNGSFLEHKCPSILDYNDIQVIFADIVDPVGPMGAKSLGEPPCVAVAPAVANAIYDAIGVRFKELPITPDAILRALDPPRRRGRLNPFEYREPSSMEDVVGLLTAYEDAQVMAGASTSWARSRKAWPPLGCYSAWRAFRVSRRSGKAPQGSPSGEWPPSPTSSSTPAIRRLYPALAEAAERLATPQVRNTGTLAGNLCQRPRCWYYRNPLTPCLKRGGDTCYVLDGYSKYMCVTGGSGVLHGAPIGRCGAPGSLRGPASTSPGPPRTAPCHWRSSSRVRMWTSPGERPGAGRGRGERRAA